MVEIIVWVLTHQLPGPSFMDLQHTLGLLLGGLSLLVGGWLLIAGVGSLEQGEIWPLGAGLIIVLGVAPALYMFGVWSIPLMIGTYYFTKFYRYLYYRNWLRY